MLNLYFWPTPNGYKPLILLEELGIDYTISPIDIFRGKQFEPAFRTISPNNRVPALIDDIPGDGGQPIALFESGAILVYLAEKAGAFWPSASRTRAEIGQWLFWQMGGLGPMMGQASHFLNYATEVLPYARARYDAETRRLFGVMERRLADHPYLAGEYSIADIACYPWIRVHDVVQVPLTPYPRLQAWYEQLSGRDAVQRAYVTGEPLKAGQVLDDTARRVLFGQA